MELKPLNIDGLIAKIPIVQGGMGVGISLDRLAGNVALAGGVGIISTAQIGFREPGYDEKPLETNLSAIKKYIDKAREIPTLSGRLAPSPLVHRVIQWPLPFPGCPWAQYPKFQ